MIELANERKDSSVQIDRENIVPIEKEETSVLSLPDVPFSSLLLLDIFLRPETSRAHHSVDVSHPGKTGRRGCRLTNREEDFYEDLARDSS